MTKRNNNRPKRKQQQQPRQRRQNRQQQQANFPSIGAQIGHGIQKLGESVFNKIMGNGDYKLSNDMATIKTNSLFQSVNNQPPAFLSNNHSFVFEHSEYIGDLTSSGTSGAFSSSSFVCNPQDPISFPWLNTMASNFESYEVEGMIYRFESTSGESVASTNTQIGTVMGGFFYDTLDATPLNKSIMLQYDGVVSSKTSESFLVGVECASNSNVLERLYVGPTPSGADPKTYNFGNFIVASQGVPATNQVLGELWCHYRIRFHIAKAVVPVTSGLYTANQAGTAAPYGTTSIRRSGSIYIGRENGSQISFENLIPGRLYQYTYSSNTVSTANPVVTFNSGGVAPSFVSASNFYSFGTVGTTVVFYFKATANTTVVSTGVTTANTSGQIQMTVTSIDATTIL